MERLIAEAKAQGQDGGLAVLATRLALLDVLMQSRRYGEATVLVRAIRSSHGVLLQADAVMSRWLLANELAARLGVEGADAVIGDAREAIVKELRDVIKGLQGPYFSRAQRRQLEVEK